MSENTISPDIECCECDSCVDCQYFLYFWGECQEALPAHIIKNYGFCVYNAPECGKPLAPGNFAAEGLIPIVHKSFRCRHLTSDDGDHFYDQSCVDTPRNRTLTLDNLHPEPPVAG